MKEIKIFAQGDITFASLVDGESVLEFASAQYNPNDAKRGLPYSFETGAKLALDRLFRKMKEAEKTEKYESFDWETFSKGELAVHCETEIEAKRFLRACKKRGYECIDVKNDLAKDTHFYRNGERTCYCCTDYGCYSRKGIVFGNLDYYKSQNIKIVKYTSEVREVERQAKVGEWIKFTWHSGNCVELAWKVGKVLEVGNSTMRVEHEKIWGITRESKKGFETTTFANKNIKYVVLEGYQGK